VKLADVRPFEVDDARILSQGPAELPVACVDRVHAGSACVEQDLGEPAGGCADIARYATFDCDVGQRRADLLPAATPPVAGLHRIPKGRRALARFRQAPTAAHAGKQGGQADPAWRLMVDVVEMRTFGDLRVS
jgi:hypothetical protein